MLMAASKSVYELSSVHLAVSGLIPELQWHPFQLLMLRVLNMFMPFSCGLQSSISVRKAQLTLITIAQKPKTKKNTFKTVSWHIRCHFMLGFCLFLVEIRSCVDLHFKVVDKRTWAERISRVHARWAVLMKVITFTSSSTIFLFKLTYILSRTSSDLTSLTKQGRQNLFFFLIQEWNIHKTGIGLSSDGSESNQNYSTLFASLFLIISNRGSY